MLITWARKVNQQSTSKPEIILYYHKLTSSNLRWQHVLKLIVVPAWVLFQASMMLTQGSKPWERMCVCV